MFEIIKKLKLQHALTYEKWTRIQGFAKSFGLSFLLKRLNIRKHNLFLEKIVTTPTQPQLNSKVGCDTKMTLIHHPPPPPPTTTTHTNSMSAISQLLLTRFQPNFKVRFQEWTTTTITSTTSTTSHQLITWF